MTRRVWQCATTDGVCVRLDGKPLRLPSGAVLRAPSAALAHAIAREWHEAPQDYGPDHFPLTGLAGAAQERVAPDPGTMAQTLAGYAATDLLCYHADGPAALVAAQSAGWTPWLIWAAEHYGARFLTTTGVMPIAQPEATLAAISQALQARTVAELAALGLAIPALGSVVLGLALADRAASPASLFAVAVIDETFQTERWGEDPEALAARRRRANEVALAASFMDLAATGDAP